MKEFRLLFLLRNYQAEYTQEKITDFHFWILEYPQKSQIWKSETSPNQGTWLGIPWLGLVSLCHIWDFYGYSLIPYNIQKWESVRYFSCDICSVELVTEH